MTKHWSEFGAQEGKELITVADVMRHEGGMPQFNQQLDIEDRCKVKTAAQSVSYLDFDFLTNLSRNIAKNVIIFQNPSVFPRTSLAMESVGLFKRRLRAGRRARKGCFVICHLLLGLLLVVSLASGLLELSWLIACHTALVKSVVGVRG